MCICSRMYLLIFILAVLQMYTQQKMVNISVFGIFIVLVVIANTLMRILLKHFLFCFQVLGTIRFSRLFAFLLLAYTRERRKKNSLLRKPPLVYMFTQTHAHTKNIYSIRLNVFFGFYFSIHTTSPWHKSKRFGLVRTVIFGTHFPRGFSSSHNTPWLAFVYICSRSRSYTVLP